MASRTRARTYIRSAHVVCFWRRGSLVLCNYATGRSLLGTPHLCTLADACLEPRSLDALADVLPQFERRAVAALVRRLVRAQVIFDPKAPPPAERRMQAFAAWNPAAGFFHTATRDVAFGERGEGERAQRRRAKVWPMPPPVKRYPSQPAVTLPTPRPSGTLPATLLARRTWRRFGTAPLSVADLSTLLALTAGVQAWWPVRGLGRLALRTSPSGGARHPLEVYVLARRVRGLAGGLYHYASDRHRLERLRGRMPADRVARYLPGQPWYHDPPALIFFAAAFERSLWRYDYARAYRAVLIEAGHLCQTFCVTATSLGLAPFCSMALADSAIDADLGLDGLLESVLYVAGVGTRPGGTAPRGLVPRGLRAPTLRRNPAFAWLHTQADGEET